MYTLGDIPRTGAIRFPERTAVVFEGSRLSYAALDERANRCANGLAGLGCRKGDGVVVLADNCAKYLEAYFGAAKLGMRVTPVNVRLGDDEIASIVDDSDAATFVVGDGYETRAVSLRKRFAGIRNFVSFDNPCEGFHSYEDVLARAASAEPDVDVHENDTAILMYTGGTTGAPKGVVLSHRNAMLAGIAAALQAGATSDDSTCFVLPVFHVSWWPVLAMLLVGGKVCINRRPEFATIFKLIEDERCTHMNLVPTLYGWMVDHPSVDTYDLSSLRSLTYAGSPFPLEVLKKCIRKFGNKFSQGYGATETAGAPISVLVERDHHLAGPASAYLSSAGKPSLISRIKVVNDCDETLHTGEIGEICVRGAHVMQGYWKNPALTAEVLKDGWYHTGDMGYVDRDGFLFLTDRKADMIISGGENVYPKEVEDVIYGHPAVRECTVVSSPSERWGEIVHAVVVLKDGQTATEQEIIAHCKQTLAPYKCPKAVSFWTGLSKTIVGKIMKQEIKRTLWQGRDRVIG